MSEDSSAIGPQNRDVSEDFLDRWWRRMQRSHAFFAPGVSPDEEFETLLAALVTGTTIEGLMWLGIQFCGFEAKGAKTIPLGALLRQGKDRGMIDEELERLLVAFNEVRNGFAHDPDYRLTHEAVANLRALLPEGSKEAVKLACANILPQAPLDTVAVLVYEQIASLTFEAVQAAYLAAYGEDDLAQE